MPVIHRLKPQGSARAHDKTFVDICDEQQVEEKSGQGVSGYSFSR